MGTVLNSLDNMLASAATNGMWVRGINSSLAATTNPTVNCGGTLSSRFPHSLTMPTMGGGVTGAYITLCRMVGLRGCTIVAALEVPLGTLTVSGNVFSGAGSMPTRAVNGVSQALASMIPMLVATTVLTATTPTVTITYTDQDGNTGQTATLILPSNASINSAFCIMPHLASGDTAIKAVTNISISTGSAGVLKVYGLIPINATNIINPYDAVQYDPVPNAQLMPRLESGDIISFYRYGTVASEELTAVLAAVGDN